MVRIKNKWAERLGRNNSFLWSDEIKGRQDFLLKYPSLTDVQSECMNMSRREIYYILKGKALVDDNGKKYELNAGDASLSLGENPF
jgi:mannose-6-phosphate isomerase-like protein (cupin superfamily)